MRFELFVIDCWNCDSFKSMGMSEVMWCVMIFGVLNIKEYMVFNVDNFRFCLLYDKDWINKGINWEWFKKDNNS